MTTRKPLLKRKDHFKRQNQKFIQLEILQSQINKPIIDLLQPLNSKRKVAADQYGRIIGNGHIAKPDARNFFRRNSGRLLFSRPGGQRAYPRAGDIFPDPFPPGSLPRIKPFDWRSAVNLVHHKHPPFDFQESGPILTKKNGDVSAFSSETSFFGLASPDKTNGILQEHVILGIGDSGGEAGFYHRQSLGFNYIPTSAGDTEISMTDGIVMWANTGRAEAWNGEAHCSLVLQFRIEDASTIINNPPYDNIIGRSDWVANALVLTGNPNYPFYFPDSIYIDTFKRKAGVNYIIWIDVYCGVSVKGPSSWINLSYGLYLDPVEIIEYP